MKNGGGGEFVCVCEINEIQGGITDWKGTMDPFGINWLKTRSWILFPPPPPWKTNIKWKETKPVLTQSFMLTVALQISFQGVKQFK